MADKADPASSGDTSDETDRAATTGAPRWVKALGITLVVLVALLVISMLTGGGHGPGRHTP